MSADSAVEADFPAAPRLALPVRDRTSDLAACADVYDRGLGQFLAFLAEHLGVPRTDCARAFLASRGAVQSTRIAVARALGVEFARQTTFTRSLSARPGRHLPALLAEPRRRQIRHWKTAAFTAGLRYDGIAAPLVLIGPMNGDAFLPYVELALVPATSSSWTICRPIRTTASERRSGPPP